MSKVIGFIPARGGSKEIPRKNIHLLNGKPLLSYTVAAALESGVCDSVVVSSEDEEILNTAMSHGADTDQRPPALAQDDSTVDDVLAEYIDRTGLDDQSVIMLLQPTSPLRQAVHIKDSLAWFRENAEHQSHAQILMSVYQIDSRFVYAYQEDGSLMKPICDWASAYQHRQNLPNIYLPNRAIYIFTVGAFLEERKIPKNRIVPFVMSEEESVDIDTEEDMRRTSYYLMGMPERRTL